MAQRQPCTQTLTTKARRDKLLTNPAEKGILWHGFRVEQVAADTAENSVKVKTQTTRGSCRVATHLELSHPQVTFRAFCNSPMKRKSQVKWDRKRHAQPRCVAIRAICFICSVFLWETACPVACNQKTRSITTAVIISVSQHSELKIYSNLWHAATFASYKGELMTRLVKYFQPAMT